MATFEKTFALLLVLLTALHLWPARLVASRMRSDTGEQKSTPPPSPKRFRTCGASASAGEITDPSGHPRFVAALADPEKSHFRYTVKLSDAFAEAQNASAQDVERVNRLLRGCVSFSLPNPDYCGYDGDTDYLKRHKVFLRAGAVADNYRHLVLNNPDYSTTNALQEHPLMQDVKADEIVRAIEGVAREAGKTKILIQDDAYNPQEWVFGIHDRNKVLLRDWKSARLMQTPPLPLRVQSALKPRWKEACSGECCGGEKVLQVSGESYYAKRGYMPLKPNSIRKPTKQQEADIAARGYENKAHPEYNPRLAAELRQAGEKGRAQALGLMTFEEAQERSMEMDESYMHEVLEKHWAELLSSDIVTIGSAGRELTVCGVRKPIAQWTIGEFMATAGTEFWVDPESFELRNVEMRQWLAQVFRAVVVYNNARVKYLDAL